MIEPIEILKPLIERPFRHTEIVSVENAVKAMKQYAQQFDSAKTGFKDSNGVELCLGHVFEYKNPDNPEDYWKGVVVFERGGFGYKISEGWVTAQITYFLEHHDLETEILPYITIVSIDSTP